MDFLSSLPRIIDDQLWQWLTYKVDKVRTVEEFKSQLLELKKKKEIDDELWQRLTYEVDKVVKDDKVDKLWQWLTYKGDKVDKLRQGLTYKGDKNDKVRKVEKLKSLLLKLKKKKESKKKKLLELEDFLNKSLKEKKGIVKSILFLSQKSMLHIHENSVCHVYL